MENSKIRYLPVTDINCCDTLLMTRLLRYTYSIKRSESHESENREGYALRHAYLSRAGLKRRLKQVALQAHETYNSTPFK